jgi:hypothetical protein
MEELISVPIEELKELINDSLKLESLERGGVDNWDWYGASLSDYYTDVEEIIEGRIDGYKQSLLQKL